MSSDFVVNSGNSVITIVGPRIDFSWSADESITKTGKDYVSIRLSLLIFYFKY